MQSEEKAVEAGICGVHVVPRRDSLVLVVWFTQGSAQRKAASLYPGLDTYRRSATPAEIQYIAACLRVPLGGTVCAKPRVEHATSRRAEPWAKGTTSLPSPVKDDMNHGSTIPTS